nr:hypothetical protein [Tanacetum cinerariifolium]
MLDHQDKYMMKAQVHVSKSSAISDEQPLPRRKHYCQIYQVIKYKLRGRLLASFQDLEHEGGDTRSQGGIKDNDLKIKIQAHRRANNESKKFPRTRLQVSRKLVIGSGIAESANSSQERHHVLMIDYVSIVETDKVIHIAKSTMLKLMVEIKSFGMSADELDKETGSSDGLQPKQVDMSCVYALNELHLHEIYVVLSMHEANQC